MSEGNETRAVDPSLAARLAVPALPFAGDASGVPCNTIDAPEGAPAVPVVIGAVPWRQSGALRLTVVVKATFSLEAPVCVPAASAAPFHRADQHHKNQPLSHVVAASDRVPWKTAVDVTLIGHAHAPRAVPEMTARFTLRAGGRALIDKSVKVLGHRIAKSAAPKPFTKMPIVYERAHGGAGTPSNPIGLGEGGVPPNILDPVSPYRPAGFGPIAAAWPLRHKRLGDTARENLAAAVVELPASIDWGYFQSAPADQVLWELPPDAVIGLEGMSPDAPRFEAALPKARAVGAVYGRDDADPDAPTELAFHADTLHIDADQKLVMIAFRAYVDVRDEVMLGRLSVSAGVGIGDTVPAIPARRAEEAAAPVEALPAPRPAPEYVPTGTLAIDGPSLLALVTPPALPAPPAPPPPAPAPYLAPLPVIAPPGAPLSPVPSFAGEPRKASDFFHDVSRLRHVESAPPAAPAAPPAEQRPEDAVDLERYATVMAALDAPSARLPQVLDTHAIKRKTWREAEGHWRAELDREVRAGRPLLRDRYDDAYVAAWERQNPKRFGISHYARVAVAEKQGQLVNALEGVGVSVPLGSRLRRVWKRRIEKDPALREELLRALRDLAA